MIVTTAVAEQTSHTSGSTSIREGGETKDPTAEACRAAGNHEGRQATRDTTRKTTGGAISHATTIKEATDRVMAEMMRMEDRTGQIAVSSRVTTSTTTGKAIIKTDAVVRGAIEAV